MVLTFLVYVFFLQKNKEESYLPVRNNANPMAKRNVNEFRRGNIL